MAQTQHPVQNARNREGDSRQASLHAPTGRDFHEYAEIIEDINRAPRRGLLTTFRLVLAGQRI